MSRIVGGLQQAQGDVLLVRRHRLGALRQVAGRWTGRVVAEQRQVVPEAAPGRQPIESAAAVWADVQVGDQLRPVRSRAGRLAAGEAGDPVRGQVDMFTPRQFARIPFDLIDLPACSRAMTRLGRRREPRASGPSSAATVETSRPSTPVRQKACQVVS